MVSRLCELLPPIYTSLRRHNHASDPSPPAERAVSLDFGGRSCLHHSENSLYNHANPALSRPLTTIYSGDRFLQCDPGCSAAQAGGPLTATSAVHFLLSAVHVMKCIFLIRDGLCSHVLTIEESILSLTQAKFWKITSSYFQLFLSPQLERKTRQSQNISNLNDKQFFGVGGKVGRTLC